MTKFQALMATWRALQRAGDRLDATAAADDAEQLETAAAFNHAHEAWTAAAAAFCEQMAAVKAVDYPSKPRQEN